MVPELGNLTELQLEVLRGVEDFVTLGVCLKQAVFDAVMHHLHIMARTARPDVRIAVRRRQRPEDRFAMLERRLRSPHHEAVS